MFRVLIARILGAAGRANGRIWDYAPLLQKAPPPPQLGKPTRVPHLRVIDGSLPAKSIAVPGGTRQTPTAHTIERQSGASRVTAAGVHGPHLRAL
jgi:hypothetical protein